MSSNHFQKSLFTIHHSSLIEIPPPTVMQATTKVQVSTLIQEVMTPPEASLHWHGRIEAGLNGSIVLKHLLEQIRDSQHVLVVDFNWTNFATFFTYESWGKIANLHPRNCLKERNQRIQSLLTQRLSPEQQCKLESALTPLSQTAYRQGIRNLMLEKLVSVAKDYDIVVTETLDVGRLHQSFWKKTVIEDLGWLHLLEDFKTLLEQQNTRLVLLEREYKSLTCPNCHCSSRDNRNKNKYTCIACGFSGEPDFMAGMNMWADWNKQTKKLERQ